MIANFFNSEELSKEYDVVLVYRYSERYEKGAQKRMDMSRSIPVKLVTEPTSSSIITSKNRIIAAFQTIFFRYVLVLLYKYCSIWVNRQRLFTIFRKLEPDIIHINNGGYPAATSCYSAVLAAKKCGISNVVYVVNNMAMDYRCYLRWFDYPLDMIVKKQVKFFVNGSNNAGNRLKDVLKLPDSNQVTIRNGITPRKISMSRNDFRLRYGIDTESFVFAEVANLEERKGHIVLLKAVQNLIKSNFEKSFVVLIEGNGPLKDIIASYISRNNLSQIVKMIEVENIYDLYNAIDVLLLPSLHTEDFPNTIIEAMGMGKPVIGSSIAGIPEQIDDHKTGILIPPGDDVALANSMMDLARDHSLYDFCSNEAKKKFNANYTSAISINNYMKLYRSMLNNSPYLRTISPL